MRGLGLGHYALRTCVAAAMLAGCRGSQAQTAGPTQSCSEVSTLEPVV
jgi:hypothetical protein